MEKSGEREDLVRSRNDNRGCDLETNLSDGGDETDDEEHGRDILAPPNNTQSQLL